MFTKNKNPKVSYASRLLVLPLATVVFFAFTLKMKTINTANHYSGKKISVVIDAGHGGSDDGVIENNIKEKNLNLSIAKEIKEMNKNENLNIILSRSGDELLTPQDRIKFAEANKADIFVSIHMDAEVNKNTHNGANIFIPKNDNAFIKESKLLGSALIISFKDNYQLQVSEYLQQREQGIYVLKANQFPSVLIEAGFLSSEADFNYLIKPVNQQTIAKNILNGIEKYAEQNLLNKSFNISPYQQDTPSPGVHKNSLSDALFIADGKVVSKEKALSIMSKNIENVHVLKGDSAIKIYGEKAKNGVVEIITKAGSTQTDTIPNPVFTKVENEADFPGGREAWTKYISKKVTAAFDSLKVIDPKNYGTCLVKFIVNTDGGVSYVEATTMKGTQLSDIAVNAIRTGPKWIPASQNGQTVASYRLQPVSLTQSK